MAVTEELAEIITQAVESAKASGTLPFVEATDFSVALETPKNKAHGDFSSNIALTLKKATGINDSREIASKIVASLPTDHPLIAKVETAGPGFLNFYLRPTWLHDTLVTIETADAAYGTNDSREGQHVLIEFVSANPTGPINVVNGRAAALGDVLANLLTAQGCKVQREFYINDALNSLQIDKFAETIAVRYLQWLGHPVQIEDKTEPPLADFGAKSIVNFPENGYRGDYMKEIAQEILEEQGAGYEDKTDAERIEAFRAPALEKCLAMQKRALDAFGLVYDMWFYESSLYEKGAVETSLEKLKADGRTYEKDGALWLKSAEFGDDKDRVLVRSNEKATYIAADIAYHDDKFRRGQDILINIWGADHHGYVSRLKAGMAALGYDPKNLQIILTQMVSLVRDGEPVIGGKRKGNVIELKEDMIDEIGKDAARFYFLLNSYETPATVDLELAKKQSNDNPVYYVQYAHARLCNILRKAEEQGVTVSAAKDADRSLLTHEAELDVLRKLLDYPNEVQYAATEYAPAPIDTLCNGFSSLLNVFYENCRVLPSIENPGDPALTTARLALVNSARIVLRNLLTLLGISSPERM